MSYDRVAKGTNFRALFTHIHNGYPRTPQRATNRYWNLGFRTFRNARAPLTTVTTTVTTTGAPQ